MNKYELINTEARLKELRIILLDSIKPFHAQIDTRQANKYDKIYYKRVSKLIGLLWKDMQDLQTMYDKAKNNN